MNKNKFLALKAKRAAELKAQQQIAAAGPYKLSMSFCVDEVNTVVDDYREDRKIKFRITHLKLSSLSSWIILNLIHLPKQKFLSF